MRRQALLSALIAFFLTTAIASAGIYGVVTVLQSEATFLDDVQADRTESAPAPGLGFRSQPSGAGNAEVNSIAIRVSQISGGSLVPAERAELQLVQDSILVYEESLGQGGVVQVTGVPEGLYSVFVSGPDGFAAARAGLSLSGPVMEIGLVPWVDMPVAEAALAADVYGDATTATLGETVGDDWENLLEGNPFVIAADGAVHGRISQVSGPDGESQSIVNTRVMFVRNGEVIAESLTDEHGEFALTGLEAGAHSFVVASSLGYLAVGTEIMADEGVAGVQGTDVRFVSYNHGGYSVNCHPCPPGDIRAGGGHYGPGHGGVHPHGGGAGGGIGGGGGGPIGGGGGLFGGGLLGPLLLGLGAGAIGFAIADDDDDDDSP